MQTTRVAVFSLLMLFAPASTHAQSDDDALNILVERPAITPEQEAARLAAGAARPGGGSGASLLPKAGAPGGPPAALPHVIDVPTVLRDGSPESSAKK